MGSLLVLTSDSVSASMLDLIAETAVSSAQDQCNVLERTASATIATPAMAASFGELPLPLLRLLSLISSPRFSH